MAAGDITRALERSLRDSDCLDLESLCVSAGSSAWAVVCDLVLVDYDGNAVDASILAAVTLYNVVIAFSSKLFLLGCGFARFPTSRGDGSLWRWFQRTGVMAGGKLHKGMTANVSVSVFQR